MIRFICVQDLCTGLSHESECIHSWLRMRYISGAYFGDNLFELPSCVKYQSKHQDEKNNIENRNMGIILIFLMVVMGFPSSGCKIREEPRSPDKLGSHLATGSHRQCVRCCGSN